VASCSLGISNDFGEFSDAVTPEQIFLCSRLPNSFRSLPARASSPLARTITPRGAIREPGRGVWLIDRAIHALLLFMKPCRICNVEAYEITAHQIKKHDYICRPCKNAHNRLYKRGKRPPKTGYRLRTLQPVLERLLLRVKKTKNCWIWQGCKAKGYGVIGVGRRGGKQRGAHIVLYELTVGPVPQGMELDHLCRNRACVRPDHLEPVTHQENCLRGMAPTAIAFRTNLCLRGHSFTEDNTYWHRGKRGCKICRNAARERWRKRASNPA
jgi:hypothetical protein